MNKEKGFVPIDREILDDPIWMRAVPFDDRSALIDLILRANYKKKEWKPSKSRNTITIDQNEIFVSYEKLADRWNWSKGRVIRFIKSLEDDGIISVKSSGTGTILSLIKYRVVGYSRTDSRTDSDTDSRTDDRTVSRTDSGTVAGTRLNKENKDKESIRKINKEKEEASPRLGYGGRIIEE